MTTDPAVVSQFKVTPTSDSIIGTSGNDLLNGTNAADVVLGAAGNDVVRGLDDNDYVDGGKGNDIVAGGSGDDQVFGRDGNDKLNGGDGADRIEGGAGNDVASGDGGNDVFIATPQDGNDVYSGDLGTDTLNLSATTAAAVISLRFGFASSADIGHDLLSSIENVVGSSGDDRITGDNGANRLEGGLGDDLLTGRGGNDTFAFGVSFGSDTITDFVFGAGPGDVIELDQALFADFDAVLLATTDLGADLEISASATDVIILQDVASIASLAPDDFQFV
jgi:Ca2+-binding RTX toxin-like protein